MSPNYTKQHVICMRKNFDLMAVYTRVFCVRFSVRDGAAAQLFPLRDHVCDCARKTKGAVGQWRHHGRRNGCKKREC
jgi:hypothetical protein